MNRLNLVIDKKFWIRGDGYEYSKLLRTSDGKMCCLGFLALECGLDEGRIENMETPTDVGKNGSEFWDWLMEDNGLDSVECTRVVRINDNSHVSDSERMRELYDIFSEHEIDVTFV